MAQSTASIIDKSLTDAQRAFIQMCPLNPGLIITPQDQAQCLDDLLSVIFLERERESPSFVEKNTEIETFNSVQHSLEAPSAVQSWSEFLQLAQLLPSMQPHYPMPEQQQQQQQQQQPQPQQQQPTLCPATSLDIISLIHAHSTRQSMAEPTTEDSKKPAVTAMDVSQLLDTIDDSMHQVMLTSQLHSQNLDSEREKMRQSLCISQSTSYPTSYFPNKALKTYPCHAHLARLAKSTGGAHKISYLHVWNEHGDVFFGPIAMSSLDLRNISISQGAINLSNNLKRMHCTAMLCFYAARHVSPDDIKSLCAQLEASHQRYAAKTTSVDCKETDNPLRKICVKVTLALNHSTKLTKDN